MYKLWVRWEASLFIRRQRHVSPTMVAKTGEETHMYTAPLVGTRARWRESLGFQSVQTPLPDCWFHVLWDVSSVTQSGLLRITRGSMHYVTPVGLSQGKVQSRSWWCNQRSRPASTPMRTFCLRSTKTKNTQHKLLRLVLQIFTDFPKVGLECLNMWFKYQTYLDKNAGQVVWFVVVGVGVRGQDLPDLILAIHL